MVLKMASDTATTEAGASGRASRRSFSISSRRPALLRKASYAAVVIAHFAEVCAFAADEVDEFLVHGVHGEREVPDGGLGLAVEDAGDARVDVLDHVRQHGVAVAGYGVQGRDHAHGVEDAAGGQGADLAHAEQVRAFEFLVDLGHDRPQFRVGQEQVLEVHVLQAE